MENIGYYDRIPILKIGEPTYNGKIYNLDDVNHILSLYKKSYIVFGGFDRSSDNPPFHISTITHSIKNLYIDDDILYVSVRFVTTGFNGIGYMMYKELEKQYGLFLNIIDDRLVTIDFKMIDNDNRIFDTSETYDRFEKWED